MITFTGPGAPARAGFPRKKSLSPREMQVMKCLAQGLSRSQAAARLGISPHTLKAHLLRVYRFLGVINTAQALMKLKSEDLGLVAAPSTPLPEGQQVHQEPAGLKLTFEVLVRLDPPEK